MKSLTTYNSEKAVEAMKEINTFTIASGSSEMPLEEINAEIEQYRKERKANK